ncbi:hypothetical protein [Bifidobacterium adolescentis]|jgi:hypothetical protein|uniref:hypothetical protein n=1 Tax=Bifidobacterium adolescentis TaxID=1680 RepID=UPI0034A5C7AD
MPKASDQEQAERCATPRRDLSKSEYTSAFRWRSRRIDSSVAAHASLVIAENDGLSIDEAIAKVTGGRVNPAMPAPHPAPERHEPIVVTAEPERAPLGEDAEELMFVDFDQIPRDMQPNRTPNPRYFGVAEQLRRHAGRWACVKTFADQKDPRERARQMRQRIRTGKLAAFRPSGRFDAVITTPEPDGPTLVYASCRPMEA